MTISFWLDGRRPDPRPALRGALRADVAIVGAGFTGLWTAIRLAETDPTLRIVVVEAAFVGFGASGRNGGFCEASLVHGRANGERHFPDEIDQLERLGRANLQELLAFTRTHAIDCDLEETGVLTVADQPHGVPELRAWVDESNARGEELVFLDRDAVQAEVHSPRWLAGALAGPDDAVMLDPTKLCDGLARVATALGVTIHEGTARRSRTRPARRPGGVVVRGPRSARRSSGTIATHVVVATSAYSGWYPRLAPLFVPVYDYVLVSDPLGPSSARRSAGPAVRR